MRNRIGVGFAALALGVFVPLMGAQAAPSPFGCKFPASPPHAQAGVDAFAVYGWQMFIALNWPAMPGQRGEPLCAKPIGWRPATGPATVWQSYKFVDEIFLPGAKNPGPWNSAWVAPTLSQKAKASTAVLESPLGAVLQPVGGWLIDQNRDPTYYQIAANQISYDYIVKNDLYNADVANADRSISFSENTVEVKASWRILTAQDDKSRYLTMQAKVATFDDQGKPNGTTHTTLGLVGMHIIVKPRGFPQWIWTTFEQVDNVIAPPHGKASYFDPSAPAGSANQSPCQPGVLPCTPKPGNTFKAPDPLTRLTPVSGRIASINARVQGKYKDTFVNYYELVGPQWPSDPDNPGNPLGTPTPNVLANVTMESYIQPTSSCMACHQTAISGGSRYKSDFSFLFIHAKPPKGGH